MKMIKARKLIAAALIAAMSFTLTGCGEELYEMTDEERQTIVDYSAHIIAKYNTMQPEGYMFVYEEEPEIEEDDFSEFDENTESNADDSSEEDSSDNTEDVQDEATSDTDNDTTSTSESNKNYVSLSEALGLNTLQAEFVGAQYSLKYDTFVPEYGCGMCVVNVRIKNPTDRDINLDMLSRIPTFKARINDTVNLKASLTILLDDLSTFQDAVPANGSVDTVILFQFKDDNVIDIESIKLSVEMEGETKLVDLM